MASSLRPRGQLPSTPIATPGRVRGARRRARVRTRVGVCLRLFLESLESRQLLTTGAVINSPPTPLVLSPVAIRSVEGLDAGNQLVATFVDPANPGGPASDYAATIQWGDESSSSGMIAGPNAQGVYSVAGDHIY